MEPTAVPNVPPGKSHLTVTSSNQTWVLGENAKLSTLGSAIYEADSAEKNFFQIYGTLEGGKLSAAIESRGDGSSIHVGAKGYVFAGLGINMLGADALLNNAGVVQAAAETAVYMLGGGRLTNSGIIQGGKYAVRAESDQSFRLESSGEMAGIVRVQSPDAVINLTAQSRIFGAIELSAKGGAGIIENDGVIDGSSTFATGTAVIMQGGHARLINTGEIIGDVVLGYEGGTYDGRMGRVTGTVIGSDADDKIYSGSEANTLTGGAGKDRIDGGYGSDTLTGGLNADTFVFRNSLSSTKNVDAITDFSHTDDTIWLDDDVFAAVGKVPASDVDGRVALKSTAFWSNTTGKAHDGTDRIIYDTTDGHLYYDADGTGSKKAVQFADLAANLKINASDFLLVA
jgi:Ca2+-binding RTX toxin-like protein